MANDKRKIKTDLVRITKETIFDSESNQYIITSTNPDVPCVVSHANEKEALSLFKTACEASLILSAILNFGLNDALNRTLNKSIFTVKKAVHEEISAA